MTRIFLLISILLSLSTFNYCVQSQEVPTKGLKEISEPLVKEFIDFLASDEMRGRSALSIEIDKSADYIASKFKSFGVMPVQDSYFQPIPFVLPI